jgi:peptidoglycan hydrolase CwlO-like protein
LKHGRWVREQAKTQCGGYDRNLIEHCKADYKRVYVLRKKVPPEIPSYDGGNPNFWRHVTKEKENTMRNRTFFLTIILSLLFATRIFIPTDSFAKIYKWVDENGGVHWSDKPPGPDEKVKESSILKSIEDKEYEKLTEPSAIRDKIESLQETLKGRQEEARKIRVMIPSPAQKKARIKAIKKENKSRKINNRYGDRKDVIHFDEINHVKIYMSVIKKNQRKLRALEYKITRLENEIRYWQNKLDEL